MDNQATNNLRVYRNVGFGILTALMIFMTVVAIITYLSRDIASSGGFLRFAIANHTFIMVAMVIISVAFGFFWSSISLSALDRKNKESKSMIDVVFLFLGEDEKGIIDYLVKHAGRTTQAEISRINNMGRVRAFRSLQRMKDKRIIDIQAHGKARHVVLTPAFKDILLPEQS